jgi:Tol biopolymer transport system component
MLAFDLWQGVERRVYRINADGSGLQPLTHTDSWSPAWSADGRTLVVSSAQGLQRLDSQGRRVTTISNVVGEEPSWSADGKWLAYLTSAARGGEQTLWLLEMASGQTQEVAGESVSYQWSPTGALLGYVTGRARGETPLLYLWTLTPGAQPTLIAEINDPLFQWIK